MWLQVINMLQETLVAKCDLLEDIAPGDVRVVEKLHILCVDSSGAL